MVETLPNPKTQTTTYTDTRGTYCDTYTITDNRCDRCREKDKLIRELQNQINKLQFHRSIRKR